MLASEIEHQAQPLSGPLLPLLPPKALSLRLPPHGPARPPSPSPIASGWECETVVLPAAFPRSYPRSTKRPTEPRLNPAVDPSTGKRRDAEQALARLVAPQVEAFKQPISVEDRAELEGQEQLVTVVNRYRPAAARRRKDGDEPGLTLVFSHANGFYRGAFTLTRWVRALQLIYCRLKRCGSRCSRRSSSAWRSAAGHSRSTKFGPSTASTKATQAS